MHFNFTGNIAFNHNNSPRQLHAINQFTITPRYEHAWFDTGFRSVLNGHNNRYGQGFVEAWTFCLSVLPNCWNFVMGKNVREANIYLGLKVPVPYTKPKKKGKKAGTYHYTNARYRSNNRNDKRYYKGDVDTGKNNRSG